MSPSTTRFDVIIAGIGGMGSATAYALARRGRRVLGLEQFAIPNELGSSHGLTRIIRLAYFEHPSYVPLLRRSFELWRELQAEAAEELLCTTGCLEVGYPDGDVVLGSLESCRVHDLPHEVLSAAELMRRYPAYDVPPDVVAVLQPDGGFLVPELCIASYARLATARGAKLHTGERVLGWEPAGDGVRVRTDRAVYEADRLVISAGPWAYQLVDLLVGRAVPERQVLAWFKPARPDLFTPEAFPVFLLDVEAGRFYGFPMSGIMGLKIGVMHHLHEETDPDHVDRAIHPRDEEVLRDCAARYFPAGAGEALALKTCMFTNTRDEHFILDLYPGLPQVAIAAGFSGHGFKFCSVVGEIMADLADHGTTRHDIGMFRLARLMP
jgi:sarcosine oxidase